VTAEIRRGKKEERRKKPQGKNIMSTSAMQGGHNNAEELHIRIKRDNTATSRNFNASD